MIEFILKKDKKHNSLCHIKKDDTVIYLTEKDLPILLEELYEKRKDLFENLPTLDIVKSELEDLKDDIETLRQEKSDLEDRMDELQYILDREDIEY
mgnify:CR=1 FL=1